MSWTDDRIATLKKMWQQGKSASEIAEKLGGVTRNAVIGKAHRLGLSGRPSPIKKVVKKGASTAAPSAAAKKTTPAKATAPAKTKAAAPAGKAAAAAPAAAAPSTKKAAAEAPATRAPLPPRQTISVGAGPGKPPEIIQLAALANATSRADGKIVSILELTERICRWPVGDPKEANFGYCGAEAFEGHPYCAEHVAIAFQAPNRKDKKASTASKEMVDVDEEDLDDIEVEIEDDDTDTDDTLTDDLDDDDTPVVV